MYHILFHPLNFMSSTSGIDMYTSVKFLVEIQFSDQGNHVQKCLFIPWVGHTNQKTFPINLFQPVFYLDQTIILGSYL